MIQSMRLRNFKCFEDQAFQFGPLTLLAGMNGTGKSSVLQALLVLRQSYLEGLLPKNGVALNGSLVRLGTARDVFFESAVDDQVGLDIAWSNGANLEVRLKYEQEADVLRILTQSIDPRVFSEGLFRDAFHYLQAERIGPRPTCRVSDQLVREHRQIGVSGEYVQHFLHVFRDMRVSHESLHHPKSKSCTLLPQVEAWLGDVCPGAEIHVEMFPQMDVVNLQYSFICGDQRSNRYRATSVGFGLTYVLPVLTALLAAGPDSVVIVENPEAHLHPAGQCRIGELLARAASAGVQVFVETHSDHVLNGIRVAIHQGVVKPEIVSLHFFAKGDDSGKGRSSVTTPKVDRDGRLDVWPDGFFDEWDKNLEILLEPRGN